MTARGTSIADDPRIRLDRPAHRADGDAVSPETAEPAPPARDRPPALAFIRRVLDGLAWVCMLAAGFGLVVIVISFGWMVYGRYVLDNTPTWIEQLALLLIIYIVCLGTAVGVHRHTHLSIDFVRDGLPRWPRRILHLLADIMVVAFGVIMAWQGWLLTLTDANHDLTMLNITAAWRAAPLVLCGVLIVLFTVFDFVERLFTTPGEAR